MFKKDTKNFKFQSEFRACIPERTDKNLMRNLFPPKVSITFIPFKNEKTYHFLTSWRNYMIVHSSEIIKNISTEL